ncbi:MAG: efflux transporter outer membrane subunit [Saccharospirillaceae bacterium]|nr:efflux transporter outer membrane subunit [Saccharospirillaceae bacterium]
MRFLIRGPRSGAVVLAVCLTGCASVTPVEPPETTLPPVFTDAYNNTHSNRGDDHSVSTANRWWQSFNDAQLDQLIAQGLEQNYSLQAAWARLAQSRALWRQNASGQYPDVNLSLSKSRAWRESTTSDLWSAGISTEYELDFWGRVSALDEAGRLNALATHAATRTQANTVAGQIALNWFGLIKEGQNLALLEQQQARVNAALQVTQGRFQRGQVAVSDVWQQEQLLESIHADLISAEGLRDSYQQQLAVWMGRSKWLAAAALKNSELAGYQTQPLPSLDSTPLTIPVSALQQRPDVQQAFFRLQSANASLAAAVANRYPRFTLSASYSGSDEDLSKVFDNWLANLAGGLVLPLIDGGNRRAAVAQQRAVVDENLAAYQQALLDAAQEVQQALTDERQSQALVVSLERQLALASKTEAFQNNRYRKGVGDFLALLKAQQDVISLEKQLLNARWSQLQNRIQLYKAVSHGDFSGEETSS